MDMGQRHELETRILVAICDDGCRSAREISDVLVSSKSSVEAKRIAADALGQLREGSAISGLCYMLGSVDRSLVDKCHRALVRITFCDFGFAEGRWSAWRERHGKQHRIECAIAALGHSKEDVRNMAIDDLKRYVGDSVDWPHLPYDFKARQEIKKRCREWWKSEGWALYSNQEGR